MHYPNTVCVAAAYYRLPAHHKLGILLHELAHLAGADGELEADQLAEELFGIEIHRVDTQWGKKLETVAGD